MPALPSARTSLCLAAALLAAATLPATAAPRASTLPGTWSGGGRVVLPNGGIEQARCRASFRRQSTRIFSMNAVCATSGARIVQTGSLQQIGPTTYAGRFRNAEYDITGAISISVKGSRMTASLSGGGGSARFTMTK